MRAPVRKAVIPAAGFGTRFLPFTRAVPKEMIPLVDKPVIQYVIEEAAASGITDILVIISEGKDAIPQHFRREGSLEKRLEETGKTQLLAELEAIDSLANLHYVFQEELNGLGGAVALAQDFAGSDPFALLLGDTVLRGDGKPVTRQLCDVYESEGTSAVALEEVPLEKVSRYGIISGKSEDGVRYRLDALVEKPAPEEAPSRLAVASRYLFTPEIFAALAQTPPGKGNEIQITDAMRRMLVHHPITGVRFSGKRYDIGNKLEFLKSTVEFGLRRPEFRDAFAEFLKQTVKEL